MKKSTTLALAGLMAVTAGAQASMSRVNGFGAAKAFIGDVVNIWTLPGNVIDNKNAMYYELGTTPVLGTQDQARTGGWGGVHTELGSGVLGVWVNRGQNGTVIGNDMAGFTVNTGGAIITAALAGSTVTNNLIQAGGASNGRVDVLYGFDVNENLGLGISLTRGNSNIKRETTAPTSTTISYDANSLGLGLGAEIKELSFFKLLEVGLIIENESVLLSGKNTVGEDKLSANELGIAVRVGGDIAGNKGKFSRVELNVNNVGGGSKREDNGAAVVPESKRNTLNWNLGYAMGGSKDKGMGLMGLRVGGMNRSVETNVANSKVDSNTLVVELSMAGEGKVKDWLTARAGLSGNIYQSAGNKDSLPASSVTNSSSSNGAAVISTGLTASFGDLSIDGVLNQDLLYSGGYLISGVASENVFTQLSATWAW